MSTALHPKMRIALLVASALGLAACGGTTTLPAGGESDGGSDASIVIAQGTPCSVEGVTGKTPGVTLSIRSAKCVYKVGEPATFTYEVTTDARLPPMQVAASQGCGSCQTFTDDPMSFITYDIDGTSGNGASQHYCVCDVGCCAPDLAHSVMVQSTTRSADITWSGRNWYGPSDTGNQEGAFFPPGSYGVQVVFAGGEASATLPIQIVP